MREYLNFLLIGLSISYVVSINRNEKIQNMEKVKMNKEVYKKVEQLHYGWYIQAVSSLLGAIGKKEYMKMDRNTRKAFIACLDSIDKEHDLQKGAECLVKAFDGKLIDSFPHALHDPKYSIFNSNRLSGKWLKLKQRKKKSKRISKVKITTKKSRRKSKNQDDEEVFEEIGNQKKPEQNSSKSYSLESITSEKCQHCNNNNKNRSKTHNVNDSSKLFKKVRQSTVQKNYQESAMATKDFSEDEDEKETISLAKETERRDRFPYKIITRKTAPNLKHERKSPIQGFTKMLRTMIYPNEKSSTSLKMSYKKLQKLQDKVTESRRERQFKHRMLDMVLGKDNPYRKSKSFTERFQDLVPDGMVDKNVYGLVNTVSRHTKDINANLLSPRFFPLLPDKYTSKKHLLSPDLFPFYKDDTGRGVLPLPDVLEKSGMNEKDRDSVLELVMDVTGVNNLVDDAMGLIDGLRKTGLDKDLLNMNSLIDTTFTTIKSQFNPDQKLDFENSKFTFMTPKQIELLYGENGIMNTSLAKLPFDLDIYRNFSDVERHESLKSTVRHIARGDYASLTRNEDSHARVKRVIIDIGDPVFYRIALLHPTILAPFAFNPGINTLSVLGPLILSPNIFSPSVLSPLLVGDPLIFSPYVLGPNILSAAVFNAYVFSPYVLSPNIATEENDKAKQTRIARQSGRGPGGRENGNGNGQGPAQGAKPRTSQQMISAAARRRTQKQNPQQARNKKPGKKPPPPQQRSLSPKPGPKNGPKGQRAAGKGRNAKRKPPAKPGNHNRPGAGPGAKKQTPQQIRQAQREARQQALQRRRQHKARAMKKRKWAMNVIKQLKAFSKMKAEKKRPNRQHWRRVAVQYCKRYPGQALCRGGKIPWFRDVDKMIEGVDRRNIKKILPRVPRRQIKHPLANVKKELAEKAREARKRAQAQVADKDAVAKIKSICRGRNCRKQPEKALQKKENILSKLVDFEKRFQKRSRLPKKPAAAAAGAGAAASGAALAADVGSDTDDDDDEDDEAVEDLSNKVQLRLDRTLQVKQALLEKAGLTEDVEAEDDGVLEGDLMITEEQANILLNELGQADEGADAVKLTDTSESDSDLTDSEDNGDVSETSDNENTSTLAPQRTLEAGETTVASDAFQHPEAPPIPPPPGSSGSRKKRSAIFFEDSSFAVSRWNQYSPIPFYMDESLDDVDRNDVRSGLLEIQQRTCIRFQELSSPISGNYIHYLKVENAAYCGLSYIGKVNPANPIYLSFSCPNFRGVVIHETMHALGVAHQHQRTDRDNVNPGTNQAVLGQRKQMSARDVEILKKMYCMPSCTDTNVYCGVWALQGLCTSSSNGACNFDKKKPMNTIWILLLISVIIVFASSQTTTNSPQPMDQPTETKSKKQKETLLRSLTRFETPFHNEFNFYRGVRLKNDNVSDRVQRRLNKTLEVKKELLKKAGISNTTEAEDDGAIEGDILLTEERADELLNLLNQTDQSIPEVPKLKSNVDNSIFSNEDLQEQCESDGEEDEDKIPSQNIQSTTDGTINDIGTKSEFTG
ncbi:hypothetical protein WR25_16264 [Diploscapter pachys]|uniref:Peptidase M12A domain-containing protein n=1 Tax=Diploscapter pachys TaxID=2018661 RepID=A0A2A2L842_9BILA|nr:hypothetical protein WR25_16264 [Diploscapter pachys]